MLNLDLSRLVKDDAEKGIFSVHRDLFRRPEIFELEMTAIFESTWVFLGFASQAPAPHDYFTSWIGRQPVIVSRDEDGRLHALMNTCRHRGVLLCDTDRGHKKSHVCRYHGWVYDSAGKNKNVKDEPAGGYSDAFRAQSHDLLQVPRFEEYRGLLFGSLELDVPPLKEHLGDARVFLDLVLDQGPQGMELVPGVSRYRFNANWKLQLENCLDVYHLTSTHPSFMEIVSRRSSGESQNNLRSLDFRKYRLPGMERGSFTFPNGHAVIWGTNAAPEVRPLWAGIEEVRSRVGEHRADWMLCTRNLTIFPNVQFADNASLQVRIIRPLSVDATEMTIYCLGPVGESDAARTHRIRQYEDFFNSTGLATPDDTTLYEYCQAGYRAERVEWQQGYDRGMAKVVAGANDHAKRLGIEPATSLVGPFELQDETVFHATYREWARLMSRRNRG